MGGLRRLFKMTSELCQLPCVMISLYLYSMSRMTLTLNRGSVDDEFPDLSKHNNYMARFLSKEMYGRLRELSTPNGVTIDEVIQTGVDNPGMVQAQGAEVTGTGTQHGII